MKEDLKPKEKDYSILFKMMSMTREEAKATASTESRSKERIDRYRNDAAGFMRYYFPHYVRLEQAPWQKALLDILSKPEWDFRKNCYVWKMTKEQSDELKRWERDENRHFTPDQLDCIRVIGLVASREQGKSTVFVRLLLIWMAVYKYFRFGVIFRSTDTMADNFLRDTADEFVSNKKLSADFGDLKGKVWKDGQYILKNGVVMVAQGRGTDVRGLVQGPFRPDLIWLDDMTTDSDKRSLKVMDATWDWIESAVFGLSKTAMIIYVNTIFNSDDPMNRLQMKIADREQPGGLAVRFACTLDDGSSAWPELWTKEDLDAKRAEVGYSTWETEYMCRVMDSDEKPLRKDWFQFIPQSELKSKGDYIIEFGIDPQAEGTDDAAIAVTGKDLETGRLDVLEVWERDGASIQQFVDALVRLWRKWTPMRIIWEANSFANVYSKLLTEMLQSQGIYLPITPVNATGSKETRALFMQPYIENGSMVFAEQTKEGAFLQKLWRFPSKGINDGPVDALYYSIIDHFGNLSIPTGSASVRRNNRLPGLLGRYRNG